MPRSVRRLLLKGKRSAENWLMAVDHEREWRKEGVLGKNQVK